MTCSGGLSTDCLSCSGSLFLNSLNHTCSAICPSGYYKNVSSNKCLSCNSNCHTCFGGNTDNCSSCTGLLYFNSLTNECSSTCPGGYYANTSNNICTVCDSTCLTCT